MSYPGAALLAGERVVVHRHPHWRCLVVPVLTLLTVTVAATFAAAAASTQDWQPAAHTTATAAAAAVWTLAVATLVLRPLARWQSTHFVITDRRVMTRHGVLTRSGVDIPLARIDGVELFRGVGDRVFGTGTLVIDAAAQDPLVVADLPRAPELHRVLYQELFDTRGGEVRDGR